MPWTPIMIVIKSEAAKIMAKTTSMVRKIVFLTFSPPAIEKGE